MDTTEDKKNDESATCHSLPCKIEFTGKAPVCLYFQPQSVENDTSSNSNSGSSSTLFQAAQFRGRGLLAFSSSSNSPPTHPQETELHGRLLTVNSDKTGVSVQATFEHLTEWHHEHQPAAVHQATKLNKNPNRVQLARDWFAIAAALHAPVPVPVPVES